MGCFIHFVVCYARCPFCDSYRQKRYELAAVHVDRVKFKDIDEKADAVARYGA